MSFVKMEAQRFSEICPMSHNQKVTETRFAPWTSKFMILTTVSTAFTYKKLC